MSPFPAGHRGFGAEAGRRGGSRRESLMRLIVWVGQAPRRYLG